MQSPADHEGQLTKWVSVGNGKDASAVGVCAHVVDGLVEEARQTDREVVRAVAVNHQVRVSDVALVVVGVQIDTIPAGREHELETNAVGAVGINVVLGGQEVTIQRTLGGLGVVEAVETKGALSQVGLSGLTQGGPQGLGGIGILVAGITNSVVAAVGISGDHAESGGEGNDGLVGWTGGGVQEVVAVDEVSTRNIFGRRGSVKNLRKHAADISDGLVLAGLIISEQRVGGPVGGLVSGDGTRSAVGGDKRVVVSGAAEACVVPCVSHVHWDVGSYQDRLTTTTEDLVGVGTGDLVVVDQRIQASATTDTAALHTPEGRDRSADGGEGQGDDLDRTHCDVCLCGFGWNG